jgi:hypothetical protein
MVIDIVLEEMTTTDAVTDERYQSLRECCLFLYAKKKTKTFQHFNQQTINITIQSYSD